MSDDIIQRKKRNTIMIVFRFGGPNRPYFELYIKKGPIMCLLI